MSLEDKVEKLNNTLERLIDAFAANTAALGGAPADSAKASKSDKTASKSTGGKKGAASSKKSAITQDEVLAAITELKDTHGLDYAKEIVRGPGKAKLMTDIKEAQFEAVMKAVAAKMEELGGEADEDEDEDEDEDDDI